MAQNEREKYVGQFEVLIYMYVESRGPIFVTALLGHFEVYLVL